MRGGEMDSLTLLKRGSGASSTGGGVCWRAETSLEGAAGSAGGSAIVRAWGLRRLRPPRRPRRRMPRRGASETSPAETSAAGATMVSNVVAVSSKGKAGSGTERTGGENSKSPEGAILCVGEACPPRRTAASCALVFQSARRKRSAAVEYHLAASAFWLAVSKWRASSKATIAS